MKRKYETPMIAVEHYELTQAIAACDRKINFLSSECVLNDSDATGQMKDMAEWAGWFVEGHCGLFGTNGDERDGLCYHTNSNTAFNS